ncbi:MAG: tetratricopeptide repeat protein, partial [Planctomycetota bacterium]
MNRTPSPRHSLWTTIGLGLLLVLAIYIAGSPATLSAPWLQGDEHIFIVDNPEVTGAGLTNDSAWRRLKLIFRFPPYEDLYQPLPILTYAVQWTLRGANPEAVRLVDVLLHAFNGLLLWWVLRSLLSRTSPSSDANMLTYLSWALAFLWALHPALTSTYAGDMGRTHLMSATLALISLGLHLHALKSGNWYVFAIALLALIGAMLCKAVIGWILLILLLEVMLLGWKTTLRTPRVYLVALICVFFAITTWWTSQRAGLVADASAGLFGDPLTRSALAVWIYCRDLIAPFRLSWWHIPNPRTGWGYPLVWLGFLLAAATVMHAAWASRHPAFRGVTIGWAWCWALLLPLIGLVGAREAAAVDRYLYQPLMGIMLVLGVTLARVLATQRAGSRSGTNTRIIGVAALLGAVLLLWDIPHVRMFRSTIRRADRIVKLNPGDPRALEALAASYDFAINHTLGPDDLSRIPTGQSQRPFFLSRFVSTLFEAASVEDLEKFFPDSADRAPFHRRLAYKFHTAGQYAASLEQARLAHELQPNEFRTWVRLAHAYRGLGRWREAADAFERCEELLPEDLAAQAAHYTNFGYLLLFDLDDATRALPKFQAAVQTGRARKEAHLGLARCEIRVGQGA